MKIHRTEADLSAYLVPGRPTRAFRRMPIGGNGFATESREATDGAECEAAGGFIRIS